MGFTSKATLRLALRPGDAPPLPPAFADEVLRHFDHGTQRAILRLYRASGPEALAAAGADLEAVRAPALIVWGERDPYLPVGLAERLADALGGPAEVVQVPRAGHWPWLDDSGVVDRVCAFLEAGGE